MFSQPWQITVYTKESLEILPGFFPPPRLLLFPCQTAELASALRKPQVIFHLSMCGIFHALVMPAAPFIVWAGSTNDDFLINLAHDVTDLAPVRQRIDGGAEITVQILWKLIFLQHSGAACALNQDVAQRSALSLNSHRADENAWPYSNSAAEQNVLRCPFFLLNTDATSKCATQTQK